jgi:tetratricopeptide (TPR) repeat protein
LLEKIVKEVDKDSELYIQACIEYSDIMRFKGESLKASGVLEEIIKSKFEPARTVKVSLALAKIYYSLGSEYYDKIIVLLDKTLRLCEENNFRNFYSDIYGRYGRIYQNRGDFAKALHYFKNVVELEKNVYKKFQTLTDIVLLHAWSGEYQKAKDFLEKAKDIYSQFPILTFKRDILRITALLKFEAGDYEDAIVKFLELNSLDISINISSFIFLYYMFIAESYILLDMPLKANEFIELAEQAKQKIDSFQKLLIDYHKAIISNIDKPDGYIEKF